MQGRFFNACLQNETSLYCGHYNKSSERIVEERNCNERLLIMVELVLVLCPAGLNIVDVRVFSNGKTAKDAWERECTTGTNTFGQLISNSTDYITRLHRKRLVGKLFADMKHKFLTFVYIRYPSDI